MISNFSLWFINGVSSYFIILPLTLFFTSLNFWERNTSVIQIVINLFVLDLWTYWWHRINHIIPFLWRFHLIHHLDEHLDVTSALRFHFGEVFLSVLARGILIIGLAIPFSDILIFETLDLRYFSPFQLKTTQNNRKATIPNYCHPQPPLDPSSQTSP